MLRSVRRVLSSCLPVLALLPACGGVDSGAPPEDEPIERSAEALVFQPAQHPMDPSIFANVLRSTVGPQVMGFAAAAGRNGLIAAQVASGKARSTTDGSVLMTPYTPTNVGSVAKYASGVALLHLFEERPEKTLDQWLDEPFWRYLPTRFLANTHPSFIGVRIKHLLQHQTGLHTSSLDLFAVLEAGVDPTEIGVVRDYANMNFMLLTYIMPGIADPAVKAANDAYAAQPGVTLEDVRLRLNRQYEQVMKDRVLPNVSFVVEPSCHPTQDLVATPPALMYASRTDVNPGIIQQVWDSEDGCHANWGWYFSVHDLVRYGMASQNGSTLVSATARSRMWSPTAGNDYMVFSQVPKYGWMQTEFGEDDAPAHNGSLNWSGRSAQASFVVVPDGTVLAIAVNSAYPGGSGALQVALVDAYRQSLP